MKSGLFYSEEDVRALPYSVFVERFIISPETVGNEGTCFLYSYYKHIITICPWFAFLYAETVPFWTISEHGFLKGLHGPPFKWNIPGWALKEHCTSVPGKAPMGRLEMKGRVVPIRCFMQVWGCPVTTGICHLSWLSLCLFYSVLSVFPQGSTIIYHWSKQLINIRTWGTAMGRFSMELEMIEH